MSTKKDPEIITLTLTLQLQEVPREKPTAGSAGGIFSRGPSEAYDKGWDNIFGAKRGSAAN